MIVRPVAASGGRSHGDERLERHGIADRILGWADHWPDRPAVICGDSALGYRQLGERARRVAATAVANGRDGGSCHGLREGQGEERAVGLLIADGITLIGTFLGVAMSGAAAMVLDPRWSRAEMPGALAAAFPTLFFVVEPPHDGVLRSIAPQARVLSPREAAAGPAPPRAALPPIPAATPFYIGFTSGTTGRPKGYRRSHGSWLASLDAAAVEFPLAADEHVLIPGRLHQSLFLWACVETLASGAVACLLPRFDAHDMLAHLRRGRITRVHGVPTMYAALIDAAGPEQRFPSVRTVVCAGAKRSPEIDRRLRRMFPEAHLVEYYGASELSFVSIASSWEGHPATSVGRPFHGVRVQVRRGDGSVAPAGAVGRLYVKSDMLCAGYLDPGDTEGFRMEEGWATVGDLARVDDLGRITLMGRESGMLISGGVNIYPAEVEAVLLAQPEVAEAVVVGLPDPRWGDRLCAVVRWRPGLSLTRTELRDRCARRLAREKCPQQVFAVERFPCTEGGKVAVAVLRRWLLSDDTELREVA